MTSSPMTLLGGNLPVLPVALPLATAVVLALLR